MKREILKAYRQAAAIIMVGIWALIFVGCGRQPAAAEDAFTVKIICESQGIYQIFYSYYVDEAYCGMGGVADLDGGELTAESDLTIVFPRTYFEEGQDISRFSMDFSPYGAEDTSEMATTERIYIDAEYGSTYTIVFSGDQNTGFAVELRQ